VDSTRHALSARFLRGLALAPAATAFRVGSDAVGYEQAHELASRWAKALLDASPEPPRVVGVLAEKSVTGYVGILAALYTGAAVAPLNPGYPAVRTRQMVDLAQVSAVVADEAGLVALAEAYPDGCDIPALAPGIEPSGFRRVPFDGKSTLDEPRAVSPDDAAYLLFTSGSTGRPKGVPVTHASLAHYFDLIDRRYGFTEWDVLSQTFDLNFDCAIFDLFAAWGVGASVQAIPPHAYRDLPGYLTAQGVTSWFSTPSAITAVRRMGGLAPSALPGLRWSLFAGEALRAEDAAEWQATAPGSTLENIYGPTELTITVSGHRWSPETSPSSCVNGIVPIGTIHEGHDHLLLSDDGSAGEEGELCVTGPQRTPGYLDPDDDAGRFLQRDGRTWYRTGDRVRLLPNGELAYLGRLDSQVQIQGWRVELAEIEHAVRSCAGVTDAVAVTRPSANGLELVVFHTGAPCAPPELARQLRGLLPHGMLPREYRYAESFPLNANRKIDRGRLAAEVGIAVR
jgi:amino acid adenylation domain-containing protein